MSLRRGNVWNRIRSGRHGRRRHRQSRKLGDRVDRNGRDIDRRRHRHGPRRQRIRDWYRNRIRIDYDGPRLKLRGRWIRVTLKTYREILRGNPSGQTLFTTP